MKKSFGVLWGIALVLTVAWNAHAMPWKPTDLYNPLGNSITIGDCRWNRIGWSAINGPEFVLNQHVKFFLSRVQMGCTIPEWVEPKTFEASSISLTRLAEDRNFSGPTLNSGDAEKKSNSVPEPATMLIFGGGLIGMAIIGRKKIMNYVYPRNRVRLN